MHKLNYLWLAACLIWLQIPAFSQQKDNPPGKDSTLVHSKLAAPIAKKDSVHKKKFDPTKATLYSTILPGLGQIYNKKYWKLPLVYAALGIPAYAYFYNKTWYKKTTYALAVLVNGSYLTSPDSLSKVDPKLRPFISFGYNNSLLNYRNEFRKDQDYSALFFLLFWGLNIVDATVDAHLKEFDVGGDLSLRVSPVVIPGSNAAGISFAFNIHKHKTRLMEINN